MEPLVHLADVDSATTLDTVYETVLVPSFPPDELGTLDGFRSGVDSGLIRIVGLFEDSGAPVAAAVVEWSPSSRVLLLSYLAVLPRLRSSGLGAQLLAHVTGPLRENFKPRVILAEVEHPDVYGASEDHGDPVKRLRFYHRHGARPLLMPYFQPALHEGSARVFGLILITLWLGPEAVGQAPDTVDSALIRQFLTEYFLEAEGAVPTDEAAARVFVEVDRPTGIPLGSLVDSKVIPVSS